MNLKTLENMQSISDTILERAVPHGSIEETILKLSEPPDLTQILSVDEPSIKATAHNVSILNAACQKVLREMEHILISSLKKNRKEQEMIFNYLNFNEKIKTCEAGKKNNLKCLGIPYFKDANGYPPPFNDDVLHKKKCNKLLPIDFLKRSHIWSSKDINILVKAVLENNKKGSEQDTIDNKAIDWMKISATNLDGKYSAFECKAMWLMNLNPQVKKSSWSVVEIKQLRKLAEKYRQQNWDKIAEELNTQRTGFQCCVQYHTHKPPCGDKWTKKEDEALISLINQFRIKDYIPWKKVVWNFEIRSLRQCQERYIYHLHNIKKGSFTMEEDYALLYLYSKLKSFKEVAKYLPKRVPPQIRARYEYLVKSTMPEFSKEEDKLLTQLMIKYPRNWEKISEYFQNRSKLQCRGRWAALQKQIPLKKDMFDESDQDEVTNIDCSTEKSNEKDEFDVTLIKKKISHSPRRETQKGCKTFSEQYTRLLEYCKYGYKFLFGPKPRFFSHLKEKEEICQKMDIILNNLRVNYTECLKTFDLNSLSQNYEFNIEDLTTLKNLKEFGENKCKSLFGTGHHILPPNYTTLLGLRTLILGTNNIVNSVRYYKGSLLSNVEPTNAENKILFSDAKRLFQSRLKALFAFPIMLSTISQDATKAMKPPVKKPKRVRPMSHRARKIHCKRIQALRKQFKSACDEEICDSPQRILPDSHFSRESNESPIKRKRGRPRKIVSQTKENEPLEAKKSRLEDY